MMNLASRLTSWMFCTMLVACAGSTPPPVAASAAPVATAAPRRARIAPPTDRKPAELANYQLTDDNLSHILVDQGMLALAFPDAAERPVLLVWIDASGTWHQVLEPPRSDATLPPGTTRTWFWLDDGGELSLHGEGAGYNTRWPIVWSSARSTFVVGQPETSEAPVYELNAT